MKAFIYLSMIVVVLLGISPSVSLGQETLEGTYIIFSGDQKIETDTYEIVPGESYSDDIRTTGKVEERKVAKLEYANGSVESYEETVNGLPGTRASNDKKLFKLYEKEAMVAMFTVEEDILLLDPNIYSQYSFLIRALETKKKEKVRFNVCVPQVQDFVYADIEKHGTDAIPAGDKTINAVHYRMSIGKRDVVNCWTDGEKVIALHLGAKNVFVVDSGYDRLYEGLKKIINRAM